MSCVDSSSIPMENSSSRSENTTLSRASADSACDKNNITMSTVNSSFDHCEEDNDDEKHAMVLPEEGEQQEEQPEELSSPILTKSSSCSTMNDNEEEHHPLRKDCNISTADYSSNTSTSSTTSASSDSSSEEIPSSVVEGKQLHKEENKKQEIREETIVEAKEEITISEDKTEVVVSEANTFEAGVETTLTEGKVQESTSDDKDVTTEENQEMVQQPEHTSDEKDEATKEENQEMVQQHQQQLPQQQQEIPASSPILSTNTDSTTMIISSKKNQIVLCAAASSGTFCIFLIEFLKFRAFVMLLCFCASTGLLSYAVYQQIVMYVTYIIKYGNGFGQFLPESLYKTLTEESLHESLTGESAFVNEYQFLILYWMPLTTEQLNAYVNRLAPKHRRMLKRKGLGHLLGPQFMEFIRGSQQQKPKRKKHAQITAQDTVEMKDSNNNNTRAITVAPKNVSRRLDLDDDECSANSDLGLDITANDMSGGVNEREAKGIMNLLRLKGHKISEEIVADEQQEESAKAKSVDRGEIVNPEDEESDEESDDDSTDDAIEIDFKQQYFDLIVDAVTTMGIYYTTVAKETAMSYITVHPQKLKNTIAATGAITAVVVGGFRFVKNSNLSLSSLYYSNQQQNKLIAFSVLGSSVTIGMLWFMKGSTTTTSTTTTPCPSKKEK